MAHMRLLTSIKTILYVVVAALILLAALGSRFALSASGESRSAQTIPPAPGGTSVGGYISQNTTWSLAGSPYRVIQSILVQQNVILTIEAGVEVRFTSGTGMQIEGTLIARGTESSPIVFTSDSATPTASDWAFIRFAERYVSITLRQFLIGN